MKHTCSAGETCRLKLSGAYYLAGSQAGGRKETKHEPNGKKWREKVGGNPKTFKVVYCGLFSGSITSGCLVYPLTEIMIDLMYVLSTRPKILLRDCS